MDVQMKRKNNDLLMLLISIGLSLFAYIFLKYITISHFIAISLSMIFIYLGLIGIPTTKIAKNPHIENKLAYGFICLYLLCVISMWSVADQSMISREVGESHAIFLNAFNIRDILSAFVIDFSTSPDAIGHPFWYTHHPNLPVRLISKFWQLLDINLENQVFINLLIGSFGLALGYLALSRSISRRFSLAFVVFLSLNSTVFYEMSADLCRGFLYFIFFSALFLLSNAEWKKSFYKRLLFVLLTICAALSDFAFCIFYVTFVSLWISYEKKGIDYKNILQFIVLPSIASYFIYYFFISRAVGIDFFIFDLAFTYLGRVGQFSFNFYKSALGDLSVAQIMEIYRENNVVLFARPWAIWGFGDILKSFFISISFTVGDYCAIFFSWLVALALLLGINQFKNRLLILALSIPIICLSFFKLINPIFLFAIPIFFCFSFKFITHKNLDASVVRIFRSSFFLFILILSIIASAAFLPEYTINFIMGSNKPPSPIIEAACYGFFVELSLVLMGSLRWKKFRLILAALLLTIPILFEITQNLKVYTNTPPSEPPYARLLSQSEYHGVTLLTTGFYAAPWYYTRGWVNSSESGNPPKSLGYNVNLLHVADWKNISKYSHPEYFLCDMSQYGGGPPVFNEPYKCEVQGKCTCVDVANYLKDKGHKVVISKPIYSIIKINSQ